MAHPLGNVHAQKNRANGVLRRCGYSVGGTTPMSEASNTKPREQFGDFKSTPKMARGGHHKGKAHTRVNIINISGGGQKPPMPPMMAGPPPGAMPMGAPPPMVPPQGGPGPMPGMMKSGGRYAKGGNVKAIGGGKVPVPMNAGAGGGRGRIEKAKDYGGKRA